MITQPGKYKIIEDEYHADPCPDPSMSRGTVIDLLDSPARAFYNHPRLNPQPKEEKDESKFDPGSAAHDLLLEGGKKVFLVDGFDNWKKGAAQKARDEARKIGKVPLLEKQFLLAHAMTEAAKVQIRECSEMGVNDLPSEGKAEMTYVFNDGGTWERCMVDWINHPETLIIDYKTTKGSASPGKFSRHISDMQYAIQNVWYSHVVAGATGKPLPKFVWVCQEEEPPYLCSFMSIDPMHADKAQDQCAYAVKIWRKCMSMGAWPGYPNRICYAEVLPWDLAAWEAKKYALDSFLGVKKETEEVVYPF